MSSARRSRATLDAIDSFAWGFASLSAVTGSFVGLLLGLAVGARHALDPDHLAAVSVLSAEAPGPKRGALLGALWGVGHAAALLGTAVVLSALAAKLPAALEASFEIAVAAMLILLGARALYRALRAGDAGPARLHAHGGLPHRHAGPPAHVHLARRTLALRPLVVGLVHGLAGSGALTALVLAKLPSTQLRFTYMALFSAGSIAGMCALSGLAGWPLARIARHPRAARLLLGTVGALSAAMGVVWGWPAAGRLF
jgi:nickel/cobalt exporter